MKYLLAVVAFIMLVGCKSEVDKCVNAEMKAWKATNEENKIKNKSLEDRREAINKRNSEVEAHNNKVRKQCKLEDVDELIECYEKNPLKELEMNSIWLELREIDERPISVVEAEKRRICLQLTK